MWTKSFSNKRFLGLSKYKQYIFAIIFTFTAILKIAGFNIYDTDVMWHYKLGQYIVNHGRLPTKAILTFQHNLPQMCHEWLYDIYAYLVIKYLNITILILLPVALAVYLIVKYNTINNILAICLIAVTLMIPNYGRPGDYSAVIIMYAIMRAQKNKSLFLPTVLLANIHGGVLIEMFLVILADLIAKFYDQKLYGQKITKKDFYNIPQVILGSFINPYGWKIWQYMYLMMTVDKDASGRSMISEWQPGTFDILYAFIFLIIMICIAKDVNVLAIVYTSMFFIGFTMYVRYEYSLFLIACLVGAKSINKVFNDYFPHEKVGIKKLPLLTLFGATGLVFALIYTNPFKPYETAVYASDTNGTTKRESQQIPKAINYIKKHHLTNVYIPYNYASYFMMKDVPVFVDPRCDPYMKAFGGNESLKDVITMKNKNDFKKLVKKYDLKYAFVPIDNGAFINIYQPNVTYIKRFGSFVLCKTK